MADTLFSKKKSPHSTSKNCRQVSHLDSICKIIDSAISKYKGEKVYHAHLFDDKKHDHVFVDLALQSIAYSISAPPVLVIESDNCTSQYKSSSHFFYLQRLADKMNSQILRIYSISGHGKGEVDWVGGMAKTAIRGEVAAGTPLFQANDMVDYLEKKFPKHTFKEITREELDEHRSEDALLTIPTVDGSSLFQVILFTPSSKEIRAAPRLCVRDECLQDYGTCNLFTSHELKFHHLNKVSLRSVAKAKNNNENTSDDGVEIDENIAAQFLIPGTVVALAASTNLIDTVWFVRVTKVFLSSEEERDDYGHIVEAGHEHIHGYFLERISTSSGHYFKQAKKGTFFYKESVVYPFVHYTFKAFR